MLKNIFKVLASLVFVICVAFETECNASKFRLNVSEYPKSLQKSDLDGYYLIKVDFENDENDVIDILQFMLNRECIGDNKIGTYNINKNDEKKLQDILEKFPDYDDSSVCYCSGLVSSNDMYNQVDYRQSLYMDMLCRDLFSLVGIDMKNRQLNE